MDSYRVFADNSRVAMDNSGAIADNSKDESPGNCHKKQ